MQPLLRGAADLLQAAVLGDARAAARDIEKAREPLERLGVPVDDRRRVFVQEGHKGVGPRRAAPQVDVGASGEQAIGGFKEVGV